MGTLEGGVRIYDVRMMRLVWSEVRDLLSVASCETVDELIDALTAYRDDPPLPNEAVDL